MKSFLYLVVLTLLIFCAKSLRGEDTINVLILESPYAPVLSENAEKIGSLKGEIFINGNVYTGFIDVRMDINGLHFINVLPFEKYIEGVVAAEVGETWATEALKAQAVISRTYAIYQKNLNVDKDFHITSGVLHQAYKGDKADEKISKAVRDTAGEILTYKGIPIKAFYHSTCVGRTELSREVWDEDYPYIKSVPCKGQDSPYGNWVRRFTLDEIKKALGLEYIKDMFITSLTATCRVKLLKVVTENSELEIRAVDLRRLLGYKELPSTQFSVTITSRDVIFEGSGYGHGVGLSQWGALELANEGRDYKEILRHYYPGTQLKKLQ